MWSAFAEAAVAALDLDYARGEGVCDEEEEASLV